MDLYKWLIKQYLIKKYHFFLHIIHKKYISDTWFAYTPAHS